MFTHYASALLWSTDYTIDCFIKCCISNDLLISASSKQCCFIQNVSQVGTGEPWSATSNCHQVNVFSDWLTLCVHSQHITATNKVWNIH